MPTTRTIQTYDPRLDTERLLTKKQAAELLQIAERTIDRLIAKGDFPKPIAFGDGTRGNVRFRRREVIAWMDQHQSTAQS